MTVQSHNQVGMAMPKQTFFNLPEEKRQAIIDIAIDEFANNDYRNASVSRIVARAGIAKGSIYQYFKDKRDLFMYLLELAGQEKLAAIQRTPPDPGLDFFDYLRWLAATTARAMLSHPRLALLAQMAYRAYYGNLPFHDEVFARAKEESLRYVRQLVKGAIDQGDVDPTIDPEIAVFVVYTLTAEVGNFIFHRQGIDPRQIGREGLQVIDTNLFEDTFDDYVRVLQYGLLNRAREK